MNESSVSKIYWTDDYGQFSFLHGNRDLSQTKINKLIKDVENGLDLFPYCPILVSKTMHIIDGQHRYMACKNLKKNIYFTIVPDVTLAQVAKVNNNQDKWKIVDFMNCYIDAGQNKQHYLTLREFHRSYNITVGIAVKLLYAGSANSYEGVIETFRNGDFEVRFFEHASKIMDAAKEYSDFTEVNKTRDFINALTKLLDGEKFSQSEMIDKLKKNNLRIEKRTNVKEYLMHMEELFNYKNSIRKTIY